MKHDFTTARLKLIVLYLCIIGSVIMLFSLLIIYQASDSFADPAVETGADLRLSASEARLIAQEIHPDKTVEETEYEIENAQLLFTTSFEEGVEVKIDLLTGEMYLPHEETNFVARLTDDFDEMVVWIGLIVFVLAALLAVFVANKTLKPIAANVRKQKQFVSDAAHELRNPLAALHARIEGRLRNGTTTSEKDVFEDLLSETKHLITTSEGLLELETIEQRAGHVEKVLLRQSITKVCERLAHAASEKYIRVDVVTDDSVIRCASGDLETLLYNLIHNAIKFTHEGGTITVEGQHKVLRIKDTGIGIASEHAPHIFDRFYKVDASRTHEGSGLGLSLVREIADRYGATVTVESKKGDGTTFRVVFK